MSVLPRTRPSRLPRIVGALVLVLALAVPAAAAGAADPRLEQAQARRAVVQARLDGLLARIGRLEAETSAVSARLDALDREAGASARAARAADRLLVARMRESYKRGQTDPTFALLGSATAAQATEQARLLAMLASSSRVEFETATAARTRTRATAEQVAKAVEELRARQAELDAARAEVADLLAAAEREELEVRATLAAEERARERAAAQRAALQRRAQLAAASRSASSAAAAAPATASAPATAPADTSSTTSGGSSSSGGGGQGDGGAGSSPSSGGVACPVGTPRSYSDTFGAPRSGGRSHMGTDILAPMGTASYAYEDGTITRMDGNSLGGISLYLRGDSGTVYYYTHLSGYASGASVGRHVAAGTHIAYVGDTGNAAGIPHLHFEVMPGGGGGVNPYPYVLRACG